MAWFCCWVAGAGAQTVVSSPIASSVRWTVGGSPYVVNGTVVVQNGAVLTIDAGVVVSMGTDAAITVQAGRVQADGTAAQPIRVLSDKVRQGQTAAAGDWGPWTFAAGATGSALAHVQLSHGRGLVVNGAAVSLHHVSIADQQGPAIAADLAASLTGEGNKAQGNTLNAVVLPSGDITGTTRLGLRGIPYLVPTGAISVGTSPRIDTVSPSSLLAGETVTVTIGGVRLGGATTLTWSGTGLSAQLLGGGTDTQLQARVSAPLGTAPGARDLALSTLAGVARKPEALLVQRNQPRLDSVQPSTLTTLADAATLTLAGAFMSANTQVELDAQPLATTFVSAAQLLAVLPQQTTPGVRQLRLRTPDAGGPDLLSSPLSFTLVQPQPVFVPASASTVAGAAQAVVLRVPFAAPAGGLAFTLLSNAPGIATVPASVVVAAGAVTASFSVQGVGVGQAQVTASRAGWLSANLPVAVITPPVTVSYSPATSALVGVVVGSATTETTPAEINGLASPAVGVTVGGAAADMQPRVGVIGTQVTLQVTGTGLNTVASVTFVPADGIAVGVPAASGDGNSLSVNLTIDANAPKSQRKVVLNTATGRLDFAHPERAMFLVAAPAPQLDAVAPQVVVAGQPAVTLTVAGRNLRDISAVRFEPPAGIATLGAPVANAEGTSLSVLVMADAAAASGPRTVVVVAAGGESPSAPVPGNTLQVARTIAGPYKDLSSALVGVVVGSANPGGTPTQDIGPVYSHAVGVMVGDAPVGAGQVMDPVASIPVGVLVGSAAVDMNPKVAVIGTTVTLVVDGAGLGGVTSVRLVPPAGITVGPIAASGNGTQLTVTLWVDAQAAQSVRKLVLETGNAAQPVVPFVNDARSQLLVTVPPPILDASIAPQVVVAGQAPAVLTVRGRNLRNLGGVRFEPATGLAALGLPTANAEGTELQVTVQAAADAISGPRTLIVMAAGGESTAQASAFNTVHVARTVGAPFDGVSSHLVGVMVGAVAPGPVDPLSAFSSPVGVTVGPVISRVTPVGMVKGTAGTLVVDGVQLGAVTAAALVPAAAQVTLGAPTVNAEGTQASVPYNVSAAATAAWHRLRLNSTAGTATQAVTALDGGATLLRVLEAPTLSSFEPLVLQQGRAYDLIVRGGQLREVQRVTVEPADGFVFDNVPPVFATDGLGDKLTVRIIVAPGAATGPRVVRLVYPGGQSDGQSSTNNTLNVVAP
ncbi:MAG: hypothetical protein AB7I22_17665 [Ramlibacter sp.]